ncbi:MAG: dUTP diphosphatase [Gaiellaceae bacterium]
MIDVVFQRVHPDAVLPAQAYEGDAGLDLTACEDVVLEAGERAVVGTGLSVEIPPGYAGFVQPRSGLAARHGIGVVNSPGLIDSGFRGEVRVVLLNTDSRESFSVTRGMRIAQLVVAPVANVRVVESASLSPTERGQRGFGSSAH